MTRHHQKLIQFQRNEVTEHHIYMRLAKRTANEKNRRILEKIANDEMRHYHEWKRHTECEAKPDRLKILLYDIISRIFGFTFAIKLMEAGEDKAQENYRDVLEELKISHIIDEENDHEQELIDMLDEERLRYVGSIVLGLNDALVELTGALAGLTFALQNTKLIALTGTITGLAAALSMAVSEYLSTKSEDHQNPIKASVYTGSAYVLTVVALITPYLLFSSYYLCLAATLSIALLIVAFFNYYISVVNEVSFRKRFLEMAGLSLGVSAISFLIGMVLRRFIGVDV